MGIKKIKALMFLLLSVFFTQFGFSQAKYDDMTAREKISYNTEQLSKCNKCEIFYFGRAQAKEELKDYRGAIEDYRKANGDSTLFSPMICKVLMQIEDYSGAIVEYTRIINKDFIGLADRYFGRGYCKLKLEDYRGAILDYTKAIELNPNFPEAFYNRGVAKYNLNQKNSACIDWSKAGELGFSDAYDAIQKGCN